jgi:NDP-sugar pyrophosphorylase family protein
LIRQAVVPCGGLGTRLGDLTARTPKPLLPIAGQPFLDVLVKELGRHGFDRVLLLAGHLAQEVEDYVLLSGAAKRRRVSLDLSIEPVRAGTGGALQFAVTKLDDAFLLLNGDSWFDINLRALTAFAERSPDVAMTLALRSMLDAPRYGVVTLDDDRIIAFDDRAPTSGAGTVNGGIYVCRKAPLLTAIEEAGGAASCSVMLVPMTSSSKLRRPSHHRYPPRIDPDHTLPARAATKTVVPPKRLHLFAEGILQRSTPSSGGRLSPCDVDLA